MRQIQWCSSLILLIHLQLNAQDAEWNLHLTEGKELSQITPILVSADSLMFNSVQQGSSAVEISQISAVTYREGPSKGGKGFVIGLLSGGAVGFVAGLIADGTSGVDQYGSQHSTDYKVILPVVGGVIGGIAGYTIGMGSGRRTLDLSSMNDDEKRESLAGLLNPGSVKPLPAMAGPSVQRDVVYLKNGSIIKGTIVEMIPDSTLRITTTDGSLFVFRMSDVERVTKESVNSSPAQPVQRVELKPLMSTQNDSQYPEPGRIRVGLHAGGSFPMGEFGSTTEEGSGLAKAGFLLGADVDYHIKHITSWITSVAVAFNAFDKSPIEKGTGLSADAGSWVTVWPMTGIRLSPSIGKTTSLYFQGQIGILFGNSPELVVSSSSLSVTQPSSSSTAFALSIGAGFLAGDRIAIGGRYLYGSPEYEVTASSGFQSSTGKFKQPTAIFLLTIGVIL